MNRFFHQELELLRRHLVEMAEKSIDSLAKALKALEMEDVSLAKQVIGQDDEVDRLEVMIDAEASRYITLRAPVAKDVRLVTVALKTSQDLERIADEACNMSKRIKRLIRGGLIPAKGNIAEMGAKAIAQTRKAIQAFLQEDPVSAREVKPLDREINQLHKKNVAEFSAAIPGDAEHATAYIELIFISKALERIGDHATNIAEEFVYLFEGQDIRHSASIKRLEEKEGNRERKKEEG